MTIALVCIASYLIGAVPFSYIAGRMTKGIDLREHGSGNLGASNAFRILGAKVAIIVLLCDVAKGFVPVFAAGRLPVDAGVDAHWLMLGAMFSSIFGHMYSVYLKFTGGKGIATSAGAFMALSPWAFLGALAVWSVVFAARRIVSLASLAGAVTLPLFVWLADVVGLAVSHWSHLAVSILIMAIVVIRHRSNIQRLIAGTEPALARRKDG